MPENSLFYHSFYEKCGLALTLAIKSPTVRPVMKKYPSLLLVALGLCVSSLHGQNDAVTAPVAVDPAALEAARSYPHEVISSQVPEVNGTVPCSVSGGNHGP